MATREGSTREPGLGKEELRGGAEEEKNHKKEVQRSGRKTRREGSTPRSKEQVNIKIKKQTTEEERGEACRLFLGTVQRAGAPLWKK